MKRFYILLFAILALFSCSKDEDKQTAGYVNFSVYSSADGVASKLDTNGYCWFGLFDCNASNISDETNDLRNICDKHVVTLKSGSMIKPVYQVSTSIGSATLENVSYGNYTAVCVYGANGNKNSMYMYYGTKSINVNSITTNCKFSFACGWNAWDKLYKQ